MADDYPYVTPTTVVLFIVQTRWSDQSQICHISPAIC